MKKPRPAESPLQTIPAQQIKEGMRLSVGSRFERVTKVQVTPEEVLVYTYRPIPKTFRPGDLRLVIVNRTPDRAV